MALKTDYQDQILNTSVNTARQYEVVNNDNNTISLTDVSVYSQEGDDFTAAIINTTNDMVNQLSVDYVVEQGTDANGWYVRKWNSGRCEAWQYITGLTYGSRTQLNGLYRYQSTNAPATPSGMAIEGIIVNGQNSGAWAIGSFTANSITINSHIITGTTQVTSCGVYIFGTWS